MREDDTILRGRGCRNRPTHWLKHCSHLKPLIAANESKTQVRQELTSKIR